MSPARRDDKVRRRSNRSRLNRNKRVPPLAHQPGRNARRGQDKQKDRPRRLRGATQTFRKPVNTRLNPRSENTAAPRRPAEKPDRAMVGKMQVKNAAPAGSPPEDCPRRTPFCRRRRWSIRHPPRSRRDNSRSRRASAPAQLGIVIKRRMEPLPARELTALGPSSCRSSWRQARRDGE
jgi:hypothetical protein